ncbi:MAG: PKD domain-containing protein [Bacteroidales bacterium]|nr:PKD domain-containing protein [Bacteroidales bacterium]
MRKALFVIIAICINSFVFSQTNDNVDAKSILDIRGEIYFTFKAKPNEIQGFVNMLSVDSYDGKTVKAYANRQQFEKFSTTGKEFEIVADYYQPKALTMASSVAEMSNWDRYPTYEVYVEMMQSFATDYPDICVLDTIGYSLDGRLLLVVKISDNVEADEAEPEFLYTGMMHGDELIGGMVFLRLIDHILQNYGTNSQITNLVDNVQIYINPFANPDGTYAGGNSTVADATRNNADNIDLNRNYPDFIAGQNPDGNNTAVETQLMIDFAASRNFVMSANSHSGAELLNYPYDTQSIYPSDYEWWEFVCWEYADTAHEYSASGYLTDLDGGVTNGYAWYTATGTRQDYMNYYEYCREVTLELSTAKLLDAEDLPDYWEYNRRSLLNYLEQVTYGLRGIVTDSVTHEPLEAMVYIDGFDTYNSHVYSFPLHGDYYRLLNEGVYHVTFSCEGYRSKTFMVDIDNYEQTVMDVQLVNLNDLPPMVNFVSNVQEADCNPEIQFINTSEASESTTYLWDFGDGSPTSTEINPSHAYSQNGTYSVKLYGENEHGEDSLWQMFYIDILLAELNDISDYVICESSGSVTIEPNLSGETHWFENENDESSFFIGNSYTTPVLSENTTYYIQEITIGDEFNGGELDNGEGGNYVSDNNYLLFDCMQECELTSVKVYAQNAATRTIYLKNSQGIEIYSEDIFIDAGEQIVNLNFIIPVGQNLKLGCSNPQGLYRGSTGVWGTFSYPYNIGGVVSISESNVVWWNDSDRYYAFFYDWNIKLPDCYSERTPVRVFVNEEPIADFNYIANGSIISFTNNSTAADSFVWDFGDETSSTEINPVHIFSESGNYTVKLTASSECGTDEFETEIFVETGIQQSNNKTISAFPNPASGNIIIESQEKISAIKVTDISGKIISIFKSDGNKKEMDNCEKLEIERKNINISSLKQGIYIVEVIDINDNTNIFRIIKD